MFTFIAERRSGGRDRRREGGRVNKGSERVDRREGEKEGGGRENSDVAVRRV